MGWSGECGTGLSPGPSLGLGALPWVHKLFRKGFHEASFGSAFLSNRTQTHTCFLFLLTRSSDPWARREGALCLLGAWPEWKWSLGHQRLLGGQHQEQQHHLPVHPPPSIFAVLMAHYSVQVRPLGQAAFGSTAVCTNCPPHT